MDGPTGPADPDGDTSDWVYLTLPEVLELHRREVQKDDPQVAATVREPSTLDSALHRPTHSWGGQDLYPTVQAKAAALWHGLATTQPFVDGNKRAAFMAMVVFCWKNGYLVTFTEDEAYTLTLGLANREISMEDAAAILEKRIVDLDPTPLVDEDDGDSEA